MKSPYKPIGMYYKGEQTEITEFIPVWWCIEMKRSPVVTMSSGGVDLPFSERISSMYADEELVKEVYAWRVLF